ncbi:MAG: LysM peptidoglycan-binding domain-containing protein [Chloroflexi bacterium]|nr:LysM peptidoglycan-binding domain-containing protein [Chloroflexota bacterium]
MRIPLKPGAATAAAAFLLLLLFHLTWPGPGIWLLIVGILIGLAAAYVWWRNRYGSDQNGRQAGDSRPFADVGAYGLSGAAWSSTGSSSGRSSRQGSSGVPLYGLLAPISALAILLFVGGAIGSADATGEEPLTVLEEDVSAIDRSGDSELAAPQVAPVSSREVQLSQTSSVSSTSSPHQTSTAAADEESVSQNQQAAAPVKPIVVAAPKAASPAADEAAEDLVPESANTFEYTVEEGDTLYDIAVRYNSTVDAIMNLNKLDAYSFIHPGDVLLIPMDSGNADGEES